MGCNDTASTGLGLTTTSAITDEDCCSQLNVISVQQPNDNSCDLCKLLYVSTVDKILA